MEKPVLDKPLEELDPVALQQFRDESEAYLRNQARAERLRQQAEAERAAEIIFPSDEEIAEEVKQHTTYKFTP